MKNQQILLNMSKTHNDSKVRSRSREKKPSIRPVKQLEKPNTKS